MAQSTKSLLLTRASSQAITVPDGPDWDLGTFTMEFWIKANTDLDTTNQIIVDHWSSGGGRNWNMAFNGDGTVLMQRSDDGSTARNFFLNPADFATATYYHVALRHDLTTGDVDIYVKEEGGSHVKTSLSGSNPGVSPSADIFAMFGTSTGVGGLDGHIHDLRFWNDLRTDAEIADNSDVDLVGNEAGLFAYYKFQDDLTDETANGYDLTGVNGPTYSTDIPTWSAGTTAPAAFVLGNWTLTDLATGGDARIAISTLPDDGGDAITDLEYKVDAGAWTSLAGTSTGNYDIAGFTDGVSSDVLIRAVNATGDGADSDTKSVTTTAAAAYTPSDTDVVYILDVSDTTNSAEGEYIPVNLSDLKTYMNT